LEAAHLLHLVGALVTLGWGGYGLLRPLALGRRIGLEPTGRRGLSELRASHGAVFAVLGAFAVVTRDEVAFTLLGAAWLGAAGARVVDAFATRGADREIWRAAILEAVLALLLLAPV